MIGTTISHYRIIDQLGQGGMGQVYLAEDTRLDRKVALKFLSPALWHEPEAQQRLIREARAASQLDHPNIVTIYGIEESDGRPFIHMAYVPGVPLNEYCAAHKRTTAEILDLALQIADGMQHAHDAGIIHRDLKPSNIQVDERGRARILDFGIASQRGASRLTQTGFTVGTLAYTPPEVIQAQENTPASDIYSLGVVLYQMLTGRLPHEADHDAALLYSILNDAPKPMSAHGVDVAPEVQRIVARCLEKLPEKRFQTASALMDDLKRARQSIAAAAAAAGAAADRPSIAVLPFTNMSADPENEYFSDGLTEELLNVLAKNPALKVTGRTSSFAFKGKHEDLREIGQKLGVGTLLEGSVRKAGNRVRITTQLIKVSDGFHLWSETYDRVIEDIFAVQDDIARSVSSALSVTLLGKPATSAKLSAKDYALLLQARHFLEQLTKASVERAVGIFQELIASAPEDARVWAGLALAFLVQAGYGFADSDSSARSAKHAAQRALALDDDSAEAHDTMGWMYMIFELRWAEAGASFKRARVLAPGAGGPLSGLATYEAYLGRMDEARRLAREAVDLDPLSATAHVFLGRIEMWSGHYALAREAFAKALELSPGHATAHANYGLTHFLEGHPEQGIAEIEKEASVGYRSYALAIVFHALGRDDESKTELAKVVAEGEQWGFQIAMVHAVRGEADEAFAWLERALVLHDSGIPGVKASPGFKNLHADPRWPVFLHRIGLTA